MVWEGYNGIDLARKIIGETHPEQTLTGTIRGDFVNHVAFTVVHGSHWSGDARNEIALWFSVSF